MKQVTLYMGDAINVFKALKGELVSDHVQNAELGAMGAVNVQVWTSIIGGTLQYETSNGGCSLIIKAEPVTAATVPMQPLTQDKHGTIRFKANAIVEKLLEVSTASGYSMNSIAMDDYSEEDRMQLAQLIGYSLSGYGDLSYVSDESWNRAASAAPEVLS